MMAVMSAYDPSYRSANKPADNVAFEGCFPNYFGSWIFCAYSVRIHGMSFTISETLVSSWFVSIKIVHCHCTGYSNYTILT